MSRAAIVVAMFLAGCATTRPPLTAARRAPAPELVHAHELAPDYVARVHEAEAAADAATSAAERDDEGTRAQWLRDAAVAEAERIRLLREVSQYEQRIERATGQRAYFERERLVLTDQQLQAAEAQRGQAEAAWVFAALSRAGTTRPDERARIAGFLLQRARAVLAAARGLGATPALLAQASAQLTAADVAEPSRKVALSRSALQAAARALGSARGQRGVIEPAEREDLLLGLRERGFEPRAGATGCEIALGGVDTRARDDEVRQLTLLAELLPAFPRGPIVITCGPGRTGCDALAWLAPPERVRVQVQPNTAGELRVVLPAYAAPVVDDTRAPAN
ncbi:MAG: hypothetical protein ABW321_02910 [Polyangiales bacterium]